jgi:hypothetical protein
MSGQEPEKCRGCGRSFSLKQPARFDGTNGLKFHSHSCFNTFLIMEGFERIKSNLNLIRTNKQAVIKIADKTNLELDFEING